MSRKSDIAKLERIAGLIDDTYEIIGRHGTAESTLEDKEGQCPVEGVPRAFVVG